MKPKPLVSIIVPIYKVEKYIKNSINSVISQTYNNIELILVDDGSPDQSVEIAKKILEENNFQYKLVTQQNQGQGAARNAGIKCANGEWLFFIDSDDVILPETIERLMERVNSDSIDLVFCDYAYISDLSEIKPAEIGDSVLYSPKKLQNEFLIRKRVVLAPGTLFKKEIFTEYKILFSNLPWSEDQHFIWKVLSRINSAVYLDEPLYQYLRRPQSIMTSSGAARIIKSYEHICELPEVYDNNPLVKKFLVSRWVLGTLSSASKVLNFDEWVLVYKNLNSKKHLKLLLRFPAINIKIRAIVCLVSKRFYFQIFSGRK